MSWIAVPVTLLVGEKDPIVGPDIQAREVVACLRNVRLGIVPNAGHLLPYEAPDAVIAAVKSAATP